MKAEVTIQIPAGLDFSSLKLTRKRDGTVSFDWSPIERICEASGIDIALFRDGPESNLASLAAAWYREHLARGGTPDPVQEDLIAEAVLEEVRGQVVSRQPGRT